LQAYDPLQGDLVDLLGSTYHFSTTGNAEIRFRFYQIALKGVETDESKAFAAEAAKWVVGTDGSDTVKGRMKFCRPTFRAIAKVDKALAKSTFDAHRSEFHPIAAKLIEKVSVRIRFFSLWFWPFWIQDLERAWVWVWLR
jgi:leukotriene-A4 hydrolase